MRGDVYKRQILAGLEYLFFRSGPMTMGPSQLCGFTKSDSSLETPDLQFHVAPLSTDTLGTSSLHTFPAFTPTVTNIRPTSRGYVRLESNNTRDHPEINLN